VNDQRAYVVHALDAIDAILEHTRVSERDQQRSLDGLPAAQPTSRR
jgi:hypothetical protein